VRTEFLSGNIEGGKQSEDLEVDGKIILNCVLEKRGINIKIIQLADDRAVPLGFDFVIPSLTLRNEHRLRVFESVRTRCLGEYLHPRGMKWRQAGENAY
jgi:hypothetical protein